MPAVLKSALTVRLAPNQSSSTILYNITSVTMETVTTAKSCRHRHRSRRQPKSTATNRRRKTESAEPEPEAREREPVARGIRRTVAALCRESSLSLLTAPVFFLYVDGSEGESILGRHHTTKIYTYTSLWAVRVPPKSFVCLMICEETVPSIITPAGLVFRLRKHHALSHRNLTSASSFNHSCRRHGFIVASMMTAGLSCLGSFDRYQKHLF